MKTLKDYMILDTHRFGNKDYHGDEYEINHNIVEVKENPFYIAGDLFVKHYELQLRYGVKAGDDPEAVFEYDMSEWPLKFKMTSKTFPTFEQFSEHIKKECQGIFNVLDLDDKFVWDFPTPERDEITPQMVYQFIQNVRAEFQPDYRNTTDFLRDFDHFAERLYHGWKFMDYIITGSSYMFCPLTWDYPIGEHFLAFLDRGKYADYYEKN